MGGDHSFSQFKALFHLPAHPVARGSISRQVNHSRRALIDAIRNFLFNVFGTLAVKWLFHREIVELDGTVLVLGLTSEKSHIIDVLERKTNKHVLATSITAL